MNLFSREVPIAPHPLRTSRGAGDNHDEVANPAGCGPGFFVIDGDVGWGYKGGTQGVGGPRGASKSRATVSTVARLLFTPLLCPRS
jgi:hypothetical protein